MILSMCELHGKESLKAKDNVSIQLVGKNLNLLNVFEDL